MKKSSTRSRRHPVILVVMLPLVILLWITGWVLYSFGSQKNIIHNKTKKQVVQIIKAKEQFEQDINEPQILA